MKKIALLLILVLFAAQAWASNIFIEEGDLFIGSTVAVELQDIPVQAEPKVLFGKVTNPKAFHELGFKIDFKEGQKLKLLNRGDDEWEVLDLASGKPLGTLTGVVIK